ncbi:hypothetical protein PHMEG_00016522 [Phytophthora megakarya]|uniref:Uncharacterized protein n=1 Tax=Phytophthora megakarya TaxID=4795 RepID=A0A225W0Q5_9STRA|nr:hypothetical protein PHMEG_00016522 [Phytophthora megakarya]
MIPFILQRRSYLKFVTPHKTTGNLVVPMGIEKEVSNLIENCPDRGSILTQRITTLLESVDFATMYYRNTMLMAII